MSIRPKPEPAWRRPDGITAAHAARLILFSPSRAPSPTGKLDPLIDSRYGLSAVTGKAGGGHAVEMPTSVCISLASCQKVSWVMEPTEHDVVIEQQEA